MVVTDRVVMVNRSEEINLHRPRVSVVMITYNQAAFISQAIEGVLAQRTTFPFELIIGDDVSSDNTREIIRHFASLHADVIRLNFAEKNLGAIRNFTTQIAAANGEYIAFCEGDDFWTDPYKLQLQVEFLEQNLDCALCHHRVSYFDNDLQQVIKEFPPEEYRKLHHTGDRLAQSNFIQTCSLMVRRSLVPHLPESFWRLKLGDWPLCVLIAQRGFIGFLDRNMATFRIHGGGTWSTKPAEFRNAAAIEMGKFLLSQLDPRNRRIWAKFTVDLQATAVETAIENRRFNQAIGNSFALLKTCSRFYPRAVPYNVVRIMKIAAKRFASGPAREESGIVRETDLTGRD